MGLAWAGVAADRAACQANTAEARAAKLAPYPRPFPLKRERVPAEVSTNGVRREAVADGVGSRLVGRRGS